MRFHGDLALATRADYVAAPWSAWSRCFADRGWSDRGERVPLPWSPAGYKLLALRRWDKFMPTPAKDDVQRSEGCGTFLAKKQHVTPRGSAGPIRRGAHPWPSPPPTRVGNSAAPSRRDGWSGCRGSPAVLPALHRRARGFVISRNTSLTERARGCRGTPQRRSPPPAASGSRPQCVF